MEIWPGMERVRRRHEQGRGGRREGTYRRVNRGSGGESHVSRVTPTFSSFLLSSEILMTLKYVAGFFLYPSEELEKMKEGRGEGK